MHIRSAKILVFGIGIITVVSAAIFVFDQSAYGQAPGEITCPLETKERGLVPCGRQCDDLKTVVNETESCNFCHFFYLFDRFINFFMWRIVPAAALVLVVIAGFVFATSRGSPAQFTNAKNILIWTFAGYAIVFIAWLVLNSFLSQIGAKQWTGLAQGWWQFSCGTKEVVKEPPAQAPPPEGPAVEQLLGGPTVTLASVLPVWPEPETLKWTKFNQGPWASRVNHRTLTFYDPQDETLRPGSGQGRQKIWVIGGRLQDAPTAEVWAFDGVRWEQKPSLPAPREEHAVQVFDKKVWLVGGKEGGLPKKDVWSFDGTNWKEEAPLPAGRYGHAAVIFRNKIWVIGGHERAFGREDEVFTLEGARWVEKDKFPVRIEDHIAVSFKDKIWVIGGGKKIGNAKGVWAFDGMKWVETSFKVPGEGISGSHAAVVFQGKIWITGGYSAGRAQGNVWAFDGVTWQAMASLPAGAPSADHGTVVFKDPRDDTQKVWVIGGFDTTGVYANDVWVYTPQAVSVVSPQAAKLVFVTSFEYEADLALPELELAGPESADAQCQESATKAGLKGAYRAWLSASNRSPSSLATFMHHSGPYALVSGTKIAENWQGIVDGYLRAPINRTEKNEIVSDRYIWTATNIYGKLSEGDQHCENWSTNESPIFLNAQLGNTNFRDPRWSEAGLNVRCESKRSLYCFEQ